MITVYANILNSKITSLTTEFSNTLTPVYVTDYDMLTYVEGFDKEVNVDGIVINVPNLVEQMVIAARNIKLGKIAQIGILTITTTSGKIFDGDETSQDRMVRAIQVAAITGLTETQWKLSNNEIVTVTLEELKEALALAGQEMSRIWLETV